MDLGVGNKGFLLPRVSLVAIDNPLPITSPATGLLVFNTNAALPEGVGFYYWNGTIWYKLLTEDAATGWKITGNPGTNPVDNYIGTTDNQGLSFRTQGIQRMFISSDGSVLLANTLTIADKLTVLANGAEITGNAILTGDLTLNNRFNFGSLFSTSPSQSASISYILPLLQGATDSYLKNDGSGNLTWATISEANPSWELTGNAGTDTSVNFIGTLDATPLLFRTDSVISMRLMTNGNLGLGRVPPDESALLELNCNKKGVLFTRLTTNERNGITNPAKYLTLYNIDNERFEINKGSAVSPVWVPLIDSVVLNNIGWTLHGNTGTTSTDNFIGTIDNSSFTIRTNNTARIKVTYDGFFEFLNPSSFYNSFITSISQDTSLNYIFPLTAGAENTYLKNDGSGNLSWATVGGGGDTYWALSGNELSPIDDNYHIATGGSTTGFLANAIGYQNTASGSRSIALGSETVASAFATTALGHQTNASGERSTAMGENTTASGSRATAIGSYTTATSAFETVVGRYNTTYTPLSTTAWETADRLFVVGNGTSPSEFEKSDALIVYKNGNMDLFGNFSINNSSDFSNTFITPASQAVDISYNLPTTQGAVNTYLKNDGSGNLNWATIGGANPAWELTGNSGTNPTTNFIGTSDAADLSIKTSNLERIRIAAAGNVNIKGNTKITGNLSISNSTDFTNIFSTSPSQAVNISYNLPANQGATNSYLKNDGSGNLSWGTIGGANPAWELTGNSGTNPATNFIGTSDAADLSLRTSATERIRIAAAGNIGFNEATPSQPLTIKGNVLLEPNGATASQLRFAVPSDTSKYTAFMAKTQKANADQLVYTLPDSQAVAPLSVLGNDGTGNLSWTTMEKLAGYMHVPVYNVTTSYTITNNDYIILIQQNGTYTIPQATSSNKGKILYILTDCSSTNNTNWTIQAEGGSQINCTSSISSSSQIQGFMLCSDGTRWHVINTRRFN